VLKLVKELTIGGFEREEVEFKPKTEKLRNMNRNIISNMKFEDNKSSSSDVYLK
jgi:hypothetical protein